MSGEQRNLNREKESAAEGGSKKTYIEKVFSLWGVMSGEMCKSGGNSYND